MAVRLFRYSDASGMENLDLVALWHHGTVTGASWIDENKLLRLAQKRLVNVLAAIVTNSPAERYGIIADMTSRKFGRVGSVEK